MTFTVERQTTGPLPWAVIATVDDGTTIQTVVVATFQYVTDAMVEAVRRERASG